MTSRSSNFILLFLSLLSAIPIWLSTYPPMCDLPQHAAQVALLADLHNPGFTYAQIFHVNWFTPYLFGYMFVYALTPLFGIVTACKLVISLQLIAMPLVTGLLLRAARVDVFWAILVIPGLYGFAYQWGMLNFMIAAPVGLLFLYFFMRHATKPSIASATGIAVGTMLLFFCHALVCAFFMLIAAGYALARVRPLKLALACIGPLLVAVPTAVLWILLTMSHPEARKPMVMAGGWVRVTGLFSLLFGFRYYMIAIVIGVAIYALPFCAGERVKKEVAMWVPFCVCLATLLFVPDVLFGTNFVYHRFTIFALPLSLMVLNETGSLSRRALVFRGIAVLVVVLWIADVSHCAMLFDARVKGFSEVLAKMQPGQRVLSLPFDPYDGISIAPTLLHFPSWYSAQKSGIVDPNFAMFHPELVAYNADSFPKVIVGDFEWDPEQFNWSDYDAGQYRYFVVRSETDEGKALFSSAPCAVSLRYHGNEWWLYEKDPACPAKSD